MSFSFVYLWIEKMLKAHVAEVTHTVPIRSHDLIYFVKKCGLELPGIAAARILEPVQAQGFTPSEIKQKQITSFWEQVMEEQAIAV